MKLFKLLCAPAVAVVFVGEITGCATGRDCSTSSCSDDQKITAEVQSQLYRRPDLEAPNSIEVQTINATVYLSGLVSTDLERRSAEDLAREVPKVVAVVNTIGLEN